MKVQVRLQGGLRHHTPSNPLEMKIRAGATVADVVEALGLRPGEVWLVTLGDQTVEMDHSLQPEDKLSLIPPVGGGDGQMFQTARRKK